MFFCCRELLIFIDIIFCPSVALVWNCNTRGVYNLITKVVLFSERAKKSVFNPLSRNSKTEAQTRKTNLMSLENYVSKSQ